MEERITDKQLDALWKETHRCHQPGCTSVSLLTTLQCDHCREYFCTRHQLPEVHGCGGAARQQAHTEFKRDQRQPTGSAEPMSDQQRQVLQSQLRSNIKAKQEARKKKKKG
ncbi:hypothetical protein PAPYR_3770 [Paratrimastix pyriformis]|uniref:AN1-type domain-containing protein n=1 Tax=Paratrimastix pyriformis TaxID=342808 RepID=A0ABQ8UP34_9EUKA|nr:hypothetical protein PAPYR_3770 [Paratrimastix pyriformis]